MFIKLCLCFIVRKIILKEAIQKLHWICDYDHTSTDPPPLLSPTWPSWPSWSSSRKVCLCVVCCFCVCPLPMQFFRPLLGPQVTWSDEGVPTAYPLSPCQTKMWKGDILFSLVELDNYSKLKFWTLFGVKCTIFMAP